jgi:hypothetical protein
MMNDDLHFFRWFHPNIHGVEAEHLLLERGQVEKNCSNISLFQGKIIFEYQIISNETFGSVIIFLFC